MQLKYRCTLVKPYNLIQETSNQANPEVKVKNNDSFMEFFKI